MQVKSIRVLKNGKMVEIDNIEIEDYVNGKGQQFSVARDRRGCSYEIADRDYYGPIWVKIPRIRDIVIEKK